MVLSIRLPRRLPVAFIPAIVLVFAELASAGGPTTKPYVLHLPGVGGYLAVDRNLVAGLRGGGVDADIKVYDWTEHDPGIDALHAWDRNHKEARLIAGMIADRASAYPGSRIVLTSHSGGGAMAAWALESLPDGVKVDTVFLLAPALSPGYDLTAALKHVAGKMHVYSSMGDEVVLGMGCRLCGTMDGEKTDAAGKVGFSRPKSADAEQYAKLVQHPYQDVWARYDNFGDHIGPMATPFSEAILAPLVKGQVERGRNEKEEAARDPTTRPVGGATP